jgi:23S rRNA (cytosine1962-C5)-methyltransferase
MSAPTRRVDLSPVAVGPADRRLGVRVGADALREIRRGSPWLFDGSITAVTPDGAASEASPGDVAVVFDDRRRVAAVGLWDPTSPIRVKIVHHGGPRTVDAAFWAERIDAAIARRESLLADRDTTACRLVHGENDGLPGLVVDRYAATLVVKLYSAIWLPHLDAVLDALVEQRSPERIVLRLSRQLAGSLPTAAVGLLADGVTVVGEPPDGPVRFTERGLTFDADVEHGNKTGFFLDQRDNRALVRGLAEGLDVLDVFSSSGGFAVSAAAGGASSVHLVDISGPAIAAAQHHLELNRHITAVRACRVRATVGDAFDVLDELRRRRERYGVVVLDPPSFASNQAAVPRALQAYARLTRSALPLIEPGGILVQASCSSRVTAEEFATTVHRAASDARHVLHELRRTAHPIDHPIGFDQGAYLKAIFARVERE